MQTFSACRAVRGLPFASCCPVRTSCVESAGEKRRGEEIKVVVART